MSRKLTTRKKGNLLRLRCQADSSGLQLTASLVGFLFVVTLTRSEYNVGGYQGIGTPDSLTSFFINLEIGRAMYQNQGDYLSQDSSFQIPVLGSKNW